MQDDRHDRPQRPTASDNITARIQSLRSILSNSERHTTAEQQIALRALDREEQDRMSELSEHAGRNTHAHPTNDDVLFESQASTNPSSVVRTRRQAWRARERLERQRSRMERLSRDSPVDRSAGNTARLSPLHTARTRPAPNAYDDDPPQFGEGRYPKRRKLDDGTADETLSFPQYGLEGTLVPGNLNMKVLNVGPNNESLSPDEERATLKLYQANNKEVFRSKTHKCTILMKHQGGWPFSLAKLVVKIPKHGYDLTPLQGMVFVGMDDNLVDATACYDSLFPAGYVFHRRRTYDSYRPSYDYIHSTRSPMRSLVTRLRFPPNLAETRWRDPQSAIEDPIDLQTVPSIHTTVDRVSPDPDSPTSTSPRSPRPWHDTDYEYSRAYSRELYRPSYTGSTVDRFLHRRDAAARAAANDGTLSEGGTSTNSDDDEPPLYRGVPPSRSELEEAEYRQQSVIEAMRARRDRGEGGSAPPPRPLPPLDDEDGTNHQARRDAGPEEDECAPWSHAAYSTKRLPGCNDMLAGRSADGDEEASARRIVPHATFQVTRQGGCGVVVNFEPEVSGKYILVKLWTQCPNSSLNVMNIVPYGFAGPRQVPDLSFR